MAFGTLRTSHISEIFETLLCRLVDRADACGRFDEASIGQHVEPGIDLTGVDFGFDVCRLCIVDLDGNRATVAPGEMFTDCPIVVLVDGAKSVRESFECIQILVSFCPRAELFVDQ